MKPALPGRSAPIGASFHTFCPGLKKVCFTRSRVSGLIFCAGGRLRPGGAETAGASGMDFMVLTDALELHSGQNDAMFVFKHCQRFGVVVTVAEALDERQKIG